MKRLFRLLLRLLLRPHRQVAPAVPDSGPPPPDPELLEFLRRLGVVLCRSGDATNRVGDLLRHVADAYGARQVRFFVLPTGVFVGVGDIVDFADAGGRPLRLDQIGALYRLAGDASAARISPADGLAQLDAILAAPPRFGRVINVIGHMVLTLGLGLMQNPTPRALVAYAVLGALMGVLRVMAERFYSLSLALPVVAGIVATAATYKIAAPWLGEDPLRIVIPPLVSFLPGAMLTMATVELAAGSMIAGASRLVAGVNQLLLLTFGIAAGTTLAAEPTAAVSEVHLGPWAAWLGVAVYGVGVFLYFSAPARSLPWLIVILCAVYAAQLAGGLVFGAMFSGFTGGLAMILVAYGVQRFRNAPPALVAFLPAFWLLVPGAVGLQGVSELVGKADPYGLTVAANAVITIIAIALGVLVGSSMLRRPRVA